MMRRKFLMAWLIILLVASITVISPFTVDPWRIGLGNAPFEGFEPFGLRGKGFVEAYTEFAEQTWSSYNSLLVSKPYDPGLFAWGIHYEMRSYCDMYRFTGDRLWINRAVARADYLYSVRDVNGDGIPSWGNYNETYGNSRYAGEGMNRDFGVWDGVLTTAIIETAQTIYDHPVLMANQTLKEKADKYLKLVKTIIDRYHGCWTNLTETEGFYWDNPAGDVTGPIVNRFGALGITELKLYDVLKDPMYLNKPRAMANLFKKNLQLRDGAYVWTYAVPPSTYLSIEDISHGAIDLEFAILAYEHGLAFNRTDMERFANTYLKLVWRGFNAKPPLATSVNGAVSADYSTVSRNWVLLASFDPAIWLFQWTVFNDPTLSVGSSGCLMQGLSQLPFYDPGEEKVTEALLKEAKKTVDNLSPLYQPFKFLVEGELSRAHSYHNSGQNVEAFKTASKAMIMVGNAATPTAIIYLLIVVSVILALVQWGTGRRKTKAGPIA